MTEHDEVGLPFAGIAIVGSGNIGTDLMYKALRSPVLQPIAMIGIDPESDGLRRARSEGLWTTHEGLDAFLADPVSENVSIVFDATSAAVHRSHAPRLAAAGKVALDLTPAAVGPSIVPAIEPPGTDSSVPPNLNFVSCGGQATAPIVHAVARGQGRPVSYTEIVSTTASRSVGPGTRANLDDYLRTTSRALEQIAGAQRAKTISLINPANPPIMMRNTVYCLVDAGKEREITASVEAMVEHVQEYVPGYRILVPPQFEPAGESGLQKMTATFEVAGAGDYLEPYAGNLDIITSAACRVAEQCARSLADGATVGTREAVAR